jgi:hypothetical protein
VFQFEEQELRVIHDIWTERVLAVVREPISTGLIELEEGDNAQSIKSQLNRAADKIGVDLSIWSDGKYVFFNTVK